MTEQHESEQEFPDPSDAVFYALRRAEIPLTFDMIEERPETDGHTSDSILEGIEHWNLETIEYGDVTAYHLASEEVRTSVEINRDMYEELRDKGSYIGEDPYGVKVHLSEDYRSIGRVKPEDDCPDWDTWGPIFPLDDDDDLYETEPTADNSSKKVLLNATPDDRIQITAVHAGMRRVPEQMRVVSRTNTYYGPAIRLIPPEDWVGERTNFMLTCPDRYSRLVLWKAVTDHEGYIHRYLKIARVSAEIFQVAQYDICEGCEEPIKDPMHRSMAMFGRCTGGFNDSITEETSQ